MPSLRHMLAACLAWGLALVLAPEAVSAAPEAPTRIGEAVFDARANALTLPLAGRVPPIHWQKLAPRQFVADFSYSQLELDEVQGERTGGPLLAGWSLDEAPRGKQVRLRLTLKTDAEPQLRFSQTGRGLRIGFGPSVAPLPERPVLQLSGRSLPVAAEPAPRQGLATVGLPHFDKARGALVIPVSGPVDPARLNVEQLDPRWAFLDVPASRPGFKGVPYQERSDHLFQRWVAAGRPNRPTTRVSFALGDPARFEVKLVGKEILVAVKPKHATVAIGLRPFPPVIKAPVNLVLPIVTNGKAMAVAPPKSRSLPSSLASKPRPAIVPAAETISIAIASTELARPYFDQQRLGLVLPFRGRQPDYRILEQTDDGAVVEVKGRLATVGRLEQRFGHHPLLEGWQVLPGSEPEATRVALRFRRAGEVVVALDEQREQMLIVPQPRSAEPLALVDPVEPATTISAVEGDQPLYLPFNGPVPTYTIERVGEHFAYVTFAGARLENPRVQFHAPRPQAGLNYWLLAERPGQAGVRLALALNEAGFPRVYQDNQRLVIELAREQTLGANTSPKVPEPWPGLQQMVGRKAS